MIKKHKIIIVPGLQDSVNGLQVNRVTWAINRWKKYNLEPEVYLMDWNGENQEFKPKLNNLLKKIDGYVGEGYMVSLIGLSAGGSAVLNAFLERRNVIHRVVNVCGRLRKGNQKGFRSFKSRTSTSKSFAESVELFEIKEKLLSKEDRKKVMTIRSKFGDELVPSDTNTLDGAFNITVPTPEHGISIFLSLTLLSKPLIAFLKKD